MLSHATHAHMGIMGKGKGARWAGGGRGRQGAHGVKGGGGAGGGKKTHATTQPTKPVLCVKTKEGKRQKQGACKKKAKAQHSVCVKAARG